MDIVAQVERHPIEDDEVFVSHLQLLSGGAAANTAAACAKLGLKTAFLGKIGYNDTLGNQIVNDFKASNVIIELLKYSKEKSTGSAFVALNKKGDRRIYAHSGAANILSKEDIRIEDIIKTKTIFLSSLKNLEPFVEAAKIGRNNNIPVILNPGMLIIEQKLKSIKYLLENVDVLILSIREYKALLEIKEENLEERFLKEKSKIIFSFGIQVIIITMGQKGAVLLTRDHSELIPSIKIENVIDTTGAGDAFSAGFLYGFLPNLSFKFADLKRDVIIGNYVAGKCIQELGARQGIPTKVIIKQIFNQI